MVFKRNGVLYEFYWETALYRETLYWMNVLGQNGVKRQYTYCFRAKRTAQMRIITSNLINRAS